MIPRLIGRLDAKIEITDIFEEAAGLLVGLTPRLKSLIYLKSTLVTGLIRQSSDLDLIH